jgi:hypothetical protein
VSPRSHHHAAMDLHRQIIARLPSKTVIDQIQFVVAEDRRTVLIDAFFNGSDESLSTSFDLPPVDLPFDVEIWERELRTSFFAGRMQ